MKSTELDKEMRKRIELDLLLASEEILSRHHEAATKKIRKILKEHSRIQAKKFAKAVRILEKKAGATPAKKKRMRQPVQVKKARTVTKKKRK